ncbi:MAG: aminotransferase class V-fold PLP-dependent enzyme, partial [Caldisericota bacterium]|nr:aminotransferase class V-fold PLP-dependent enzyme [Caldisericota bacterium]
GETSTGMLNPLEGLSKICKEKGILFVVDAVSTLGGVELAIDALNIDFCVSASQKALGSIPGLATISISDNGWKSMAKEEDIPGWYLNLKTWARYEKEWGDWHPFPITLPVHLFFALNKALDIILEEGLEKRWLRHKNVATMLHEGLAKLGISPFVKDKELYLPTVTSAILPGTLTSEELQNYLRNNYRILIAGGVGPLRNKVFRVGHMAYSAQEPLINRVLSGIENFIANQ